MKLSVIKIGGQVIDDQKALKSFLKDFAAIKTPKILVHGGGKTATAIGEQMGVTPKMLQGRRITDEETLKLVTMVYGGLLNKQLVAQLQKVGCNALGLTGADGNLLLAKKRPVKEVDFGFVGDIDQTSVNISLLELLSTQEITPVIAALTHDGKGSILNTNADTMASVIAQALSKIFEVQLIYCFELKGVMKDFKRELVFEALDIKNTNRYKKEGLIHSGMLPKLANAFEAKQNGVSLVQIGHYESLVELISQKTGTEIL